MSSSKCPSKTQSFFFQNNRLICSLGPTPRRLLRANSLVLAERDENTLSSRLLQTDDAKTPLLSHPGDVHQNYSPYGFLHIAPSASLVAYSGRRLDTLLNAYALGNGHRFYSSVLMRFFQPDGHSPFGKGGPNAYSYGQNDPINKHDPTGQWWEWLRNSINWLKARSPRVTLYTPLSAVNDEVLSSPHVYVAVHRPPRFSANEPLVRFRIPYLETAADVGRLVTNFTTDFAQEIQVLSRWGARVTVAGGTGLVVNNGLRMLGTPGLASSAVALSAEVAILGIWERDTFRDAIRYVRGSGGNIHQELQSV